MRGYGETYESVPLMCDSSTAIFLGQSPVFHGREKHIKMRDHVEKRDIEMRYMRQRVSWLIFSPNPLMRLVLLLCRGNLVFAIPMA
jgi:hypothetical protein